MSGLAGGLKRLDRIELESIRRTGHNDRFTGGQSHKVLVVDRRRTHFGRLEIAVGREDERREERVSGLRQLAVRIDGVWVGGQLLLKEKHVVMRKCFHSARNLLELMVAHLAAATLKAHIHTIRKCILCDTIYILSENKNSNVKTNSF